MKKLSIVQVSGNSEFADSRSGDDFANSVLDRFGFVGRDGRGNGHLYIGCVPQQGKTFYVYYDEPPSRDDKSRGSFRLVRLEGDGTETVLDRGSACHSHSHAGLGTLTFYGRGNKLKSWSFHCNEVPVLEEKTSARPRIIVVQTLSGGANNCAVALAGLGLKEGQDFMFATFGDHFDTIVGNDGPYLVILGSSNGNVRPAIWLVQNLKGRNPQVFCMSLSSCDIDGVDGVIARAKPEVEQVNIRNAVAEYLASQGAQLAQKG